PSEQIDELECRLLPVRTRSDRNLGTKGGDDARPRLGVTIFPPVNLPALVAEYLRRIPQCKTGLLPENGELRRAGSLRRFAPLLGCTQQPTWSDLIRAFQYRGHRASPLPRTFFDSTAEFVQSARATNPHVRILFPSWCFGATVE